MIISTLYGHVKQENWHLLEKSYGEIIRHSPKGLVESFLIQDQDDPNCWKVVTFWHSAEDYEAAHEHHFTTPAVQMFCDAGSTPRAQTFIVHRHYTRVGARE